MVFDWTDRGSWTPTSRCTSQFERRGTDFWWLDWCCDGTSAEAPGLTPDTWINKHYFERQRARGSRWPAFQRIGGSYQLGFGGNGGTGAFAEHRYTIQFTGDTCATWPLLGFASQFTAAAASIGLPYVSHDIGTFFSRVAAAGSATSQLSPFLAPQREHAARPRCTCAGCSSARSSRSTACTRTTASGCPWEYPEPAAGSRPTFLRLREALVPYLYTLAREAHDTGLPIVRALYLHWPRRAAAYRHPTQYTLGRDVLVAPVAAPGDPGERDGLVPARARGSTGSRASATAARQPKQLSVPLERMPVFVRAGGDRADAAAASTRRRPGRSQRARPHRLPRAAAGFGLYDDAGDGLAYERGAFSRTTVSQRRSARRVTS